MKTKKTTIAILATLAFGIAAAQAGRGCVLTVPGSASPQSQTQHASHAVHTFQISLAKGESYEITGVQSNLTTMDASSPGNLVEITATDNLNVAYRKICDVKIPEVRKVPKEDGVHNFAEQKFGPAPENGSLVTIRFNFVHSASAFGSISLVGCVVPCPTASGDLETTAYANADDKPHLKWNAHIHVRGNDSSPSVGNETISSQQQAPNAGKTKTNNGKGNNK